jgi:O-antigen/teichoic acid export membrane protein
LKVLKSFSVYVFTMCFTAGVSFATFSLLTRHLSEVDYGIINLYSSTSILLVAFISCGVQFVLNVDYFKLSKEQYRKRFSNSIIIPVVIFFVLTIVFLVFNYPIQRLVKSNFLFTAVMPLTCLLVLVNDIVLGLIRNREKHFLFAGFSISKSLFEVSLAILFIVFMGWGWQGRIAGSFITLISSCVFAFFLFRKWGFLTTDIRLSEIKPVFKYGLPFIPERLAVFFMFYSDRFFIDYYEGTADVGFYSAGAQIAVILNLVCHSLNSTFYPYFYKRLAKDKPDYPGLRKGILAFGGIATITMLGLIAITPLIFKYFVGDAFKPGQKYAIYLVISFFFWAIYNMLLPFLLNKKKGKLIMSISIVGMLLSIGLNFYNVRHFGALGAAYTSIAVFATMCLLTLYSVHKIYNLKNIFLGRDEGGSLQSTIDAKF